MNKHVLYYALLLTVVITDAWLIAHPNLLGKLGVWFYKYSYFSNFTKSLVTVGLIALVASLLGEIIKRVTKPATGRIVLGLLTIAALAIAVQLFIQFSSGTYKLTGTAFKTGIRLLPLILAFIFLKNLFEIKVKPPQTPVTQNDNPPV